MYYSALFIVAAVISLSLAVFVLARDRHSLGHRVFALGMVFLALETIFYGLSFQKALPENIIYWQRWRLLASGFLPGIWLLFSVIFGRANYKEFLSRWRWCIIAAFAVPLGVTGVFSNVFFGEDTSITLMFSRLLRVGLAGFVFHITFLLVAVLVLVNLEWTLRNSVGRIRWQIKFMVLGLGALFGIRIYTLSQVVLFKAVSLDTELLNTAALIVASLLMTRSFARARMFNVSFYLSGSFLYNSITILCVGVYLIVVGVLAKAGAYLNRNQQIPFDTFFVFLAMLGLVAFLLSDKLRKRTKRYINRHFKRPVYDYRQEWMKFTDWTTSVMDPKDLCGNITKAVAKTLDLLSVTIWLSDEKQERLTLGGTSVFSEMQDSHRGHRDINGKNINESQRELKIKEEDQKNHGDHREVTGKYIDDVSEPESKDLSNTEKDVLELIRTMRTENLPVDFDYSTGDWMNKENGAQEAFFKSTRIQFAFPLVAGGKFLGVMTIGDRVANDPLSPEDFELLRTIADQTASSLLNLELSADLRQAKEMEAFQNMSTFFIHDLKNVASRLSLTMQNLPLYFDNPEFRDDTLKTISQSLLKINSMCSQLSSLSQKLELKTADLDIRDLVKKTVSEMNGALKCPLIQEFKNIPKIQADAEQIQKVLTNLILNANDAVKDGGEIKITTDQPSGYVLLSVSDTGCGMSKEFIERSLFRPFQTTKPKGMGIGLFHSKKIIEAHGGRIEVESEIGKGTTFKIYLPIRE